jgi:hypothetical protein
MLAAEAVPVAWQKSSCGRRMIQEPSGAVRRSKRSTTRTVTSPNRPISHRAPHVDPQAAYPVERKL